VVRTVETIMTDVVEVVVVVVWGRGSLPEVLARRGIAVKARTAADKTTLRTDFFMVITLLVAARPRYTKAYL
jgi:hypothetical protein